MRREEKAQIIEAIAAQLEQTPDFYVTDIAGLNAEQTSELRRACFEKDIKLVVVKNTLLSKVIEKGSAEAASAHQGIRPDPCRAARCFLRHVQV